MWQEHCWNYFAFNQSYLAEGKITPVVFCLNRQNKNTYFYIGGSGLDRTDDIQKFCGSGLDLILLDQDWTRTEKFHSPLVSAAHHHSIPSVHYQPPGSIQRDVRLHL